MLLRYVFLAVLAEAFIIYASVLVKIVELSPIMVAFYRVALSVPIFGLIAIKKENIFKLPLKDVSLMLTAGVLFALDLVFFNLALHRTSVANVNLFASLVCFILVPIGVFFFKESIKPSFLIGALIAFLGIIVLIKGRGVESVATPVGDFLAFLAMVSYSFFLALVFALRKKYNTMCIFFFSSFGASVVLLSFGWVLEGLSMPQDLKNWGIILLITLFGQVLGQGFFGYIMGKIPAQLASLVLLFSPAIAAVMGFVFLRERLSILEVTGIFIIIVGVYLAQLKKK